jgi:WD40 repeat protein
MADLEVQPVRAIQAPRVFHPGADDKGGYWEDFGLTMAFDFSEASGSLVAVVTKTDGPTRLFAFDLTSGAVRWQEIITSNSNANIHAVALSPDGRLVLVPTDADSQITLWNADIGSLLDRKPTDGVAGDVDWHPAGALLAVVAGKGIEIWEVWKYPRTPANHKCITD